MVSQLTERTASGMRSMDVPRFSRSRSPSPLPRRSIDILGSLATDVAHAIIEEPDNTDTEPEAPVSQVPNNSAALPSRPSIDDILRPVGATPEIQATDSDRDPSPIVTDPKEIEEAISGSVQLQKILGSDILWALGLVFVILIAEQSRQFTDSGFSIFGVIFEVISAYDGVGISLGYCQTLADGSQACSYGGLSQTFTGVSLWIMALALIMGRMRGFPPTLDSALQLPPTGKAGRVNESVPSIHQV